MVHTIGSYQVVSRHLTTKTNATALAMNRSAETPAKSTVSENTFSSTQGDT